MWDLLYKFFEYTPLYIALVLVPAIIRTFIDTVIIKIPPSSFLLPPSKSNHLSVRYEDVFASVVGSALYAPLVEEIVFRGAPYIFLGTVGLVVGNIVWILAHPSWQLRYISSMPTKTKVAFTANTVFYYTCAAIFFTIPWLQGYGILSIIYHMFHNGVITIGGIFSEVELPAPWKKDEEMFFKESRGIKRKLEEKFFRDTNPPEEPIEELDIDIDIGDKRFFKEISRKVATKAAVSEQARAPIRTPAQKTTAMIDEDLWGFWTGRTDQKRIMLYP